MVNKVKEIMSPQVIDICREAGDVTVGNLGLHNQSSSAYAPHIQPNSETLPSHHNFFVQGHIDY